MTQQQQKSSVYADLPYVDVVNDSIYLKNNWYLIYVPAEISFLILRG